MLVECREIEMEVKEIKKGREGERDRAEKWE